MTLLNTIYPLFVYFLIVCLLLFFFKQNEKYKALKISLISVVLYYIYALIAYSAYLNGNNFFQYPDQNTFYQVSEQLGNMPNVQSIFRNCFVYKIHIENEGAYFYLGVLSYLANNFLDGNTVYYQILCITLVSALVPILMFKLLLNFYDLSVSYRYSLIYPFIGYVFYYAPWILRDMYIVLLYIIGLIILFSKFKIYKVLILVLLVVITIQFRFEHGVFMIFLPLLYLYNYSKRWKLLKYLLLILGCGLCVMILPFIIEQMATIQQTLELYTEFTKNQADEAGGLGAYILGLPSGIKEIISVLYSQISPFPSWNLAVGAENIPQFIIGIIQMISPFYWFIVWFCVIFAFKIKDYRKNISPILIYPLLIFLFFLLANSSNLNPRRLVCMYPILFIFYVKAKVEYPLIMRNVTKQAVFCYLGLCLIYFLLKF